MLKVLINAYAISPNWGSEPGMGWNWVINLAKYCELYVITEGQWQKDIVDAVNKLPQRSNLHFYFNPVSEKVRRMCWDQGDWRFYYHYRKWQKKSLAIAKEIIAEHRIDIIHQLNMIGFREPGYLWKIPDKPFVWGPIGGMSLTPTAYLQDIEWKQRMLCHLKNFITSWQYRYHPRVRAAILRADALIAAVKGVQKVAQKFYNKEVVLINETGTSISEDIVHIKQKSNEFKIIWVGRLYYSKLLDLALRIIAETNNPKIQFHICGTGDDKSVEKYVELAKNLHIEHQCHWHGKVEHDKIFSMMAESDLFLFTSIREATSTVILEAVSVGLPVLSFNICGFGPIVQNFAGVAIELSNPKQSIQDFAKQINHFIAHPEILEKISANEIDNRNKFSWESKAKQMFEIYQKLTERQRNNR